MRTGGYAFDAWTPEGGLRRGFVYRRIDDAYYARKAEIRTPDAGHAGRIVACSTLDEFLRATVRTPGQFYPRCGDVQATVGQARFHPGADQLRYGDQVI
jgi:hypothetical protein